MTNSTQSASSPAMEETALFQNFSLALQNLSITTGDIIYIASDITLLLYDLKELYGYSSREEQNTALQIVTECLKRAVGAQGTLLFPVFSWSFCRGRGFDIQNTKGEVGALGNWVLKNAKEFTRTSHPMYSFMVWGADSDFLVNLQNQDAWGAGSPFSYLQARHAKQLMLNVEAFQGLTFVHYVEQCVHVPYRHTKYFFGNYRNRDLIDEIRVYSMYVHDLDVDCEVGATNDFFLQNGIAIQHLWHHNVFTLIDLNSSFPLLEEDMLHHCGKNSLRFSNYVLDWNKPQTISYEISSVPSAL